MKGAPNKIQRRAFVADLLQRRDGSLIVCGLGSPTWDCFAAGDSPDYLYSWGGWVWLCRRRSGSRWRSPPGASWPSQATAR